MFEKKNLLEKLKDCVSVPIPQLIEHLCYVLQEELEELYELNKRIENLDDENMNTFDSIEESMLDIKEKIDNFNDDLDNFEEDLGILRQEVEDYIADKSSDEETMGKKCRKEKVR